MPTKVNHPLFIRISSDGHVAKGDFLKDGFIETDAKAIALPEHGDLIERNKLLKFDNISYVDTGYWMTDYEAVKTSIIKNAPVIVEASDGVDN